MDEKMERIDDDNDDDDDEVDDDDQRERAATIASCVYAGKRVWANTAAPAFIDDPICVTIPSSA